MVYPVEVLLNIQECSHHVLLLFVSIQNKLPHTIQLFVGPDRSFRQPNWWAGIAILTPGLDSKRNAPLQTDRAVPVRSAAGLPVLYNH